MLTQRLACIGWFIARASLSNESLFLCTAIINHRHRWSLTWKMSTICLNVGRSRALALQHLSMRACMGAGSGPACVLLATVVPRSEQTCELPAHTVCSQLFQQMPLQTGAQMHTPSASLNRNLAQGQGSTAPHLVLRQCDPHWARQLLIRWQVGPVVVGHGREDDLAYRMGFTQ